MSWRRLWAAVGMLLALVLAVRLVWGWWVERQVKSQLDEIRRRGQPVEMADLASPPIPDAQNAWVVQMQAASALRVDSPRSSTIEYRDYLPYPPEWFKLAEASEKSNAPAFALARKARGLTKAQAASGRSLGTILTDLNRARRLINTLCDGAIYCHLTGDDAEAIERILDGLHVARSLYHTDYLVSQLVAYGIEALACHATNVIGPGLRFEAGSTTRPAQRQQVRQLIARLLDDEVSAAGTKRGVLTDRPFFINEYRKLPTRTWFLRPVAEFELVRQNREFDIALQACACTNWPAAREVFDRNEPKSSSDSELPRYSRWFQDRTVFSAYLERYYKLVGDRRATAVALACQLYRADHRRWPERLEQLVPDYLAAIPQDPFHADKRPLGYIVLKGKLPGGGDRPLIYYDGGEVDAPIPDEPLYDWTTDQRPGHRGDRIRQYRDVTRFVPPPKPPEPVLPWRSPPRVSTKAVDHNPQKTNAPRQQPQDQNKTK